MTDNLGKTAEDRVREWLNRPEDGYSFDRLPDQMNGFFGSKNICDFIAFKAPYQYYIECKATWADEFSFSNISEFQRDEVSKKSQIANVYGILILVFATAKRTFVFNMKDIRDRWESGKWGCKTLNLNKIDSWGIPYREIRTIPNPRKDLLNYEGELQEYMID